MSTSETPDDAVSHSSEPKQKAAMSHVVVNALLRIVSTLARSAEGNPLHVFPLELSSRVGLDVETVKRSLPRRRDGGHLRIVNARVIMPGLDALERLYPLLGMKEEVRGTT